MLLRACLRGAENRLFKHFDVYQRLAGTACHVLAPPDEIDYLHDQFFFRPAGVVSPRLAR